jgi:hypothetical protein
VFEVIEVETMEKLLEFLYSGNIEDMGDQLENLFYAADKYDVMGLGCDAFKCCRHSSHRRQTFS